MSDICLVYSQGVQMLQGTGTSNSARLCHHCRGASRKQLQGWKCRYTSVLHLYTCSMGWKAATPVCYICTRACWVRVGSLTGSLLCSAAAHRREAHPHWVRALSH